MNPENKPLTEFDSITSTKELNIIKATLPYFSVKGRRLLSLFVKTRELMNTMDLINDNNKLSICSVPPKEQPNINELLDDIKIYLDKNELDMITNYMNAVNTIKMYNEYMNVFNNIDDTAKG